jgi:hypothetical protein
MAKLACLAVVAVAAAIPAASAAHQAVDTKRMVLRLADLPRGFVQTEGRYISNRQAAKESPGKDYAKLGRLMGYEAEFKRSGRPVVGVLRISSSANLYKTARAASASLAISEQAATKAPPRVRRLSLRARVGDEAAVYLETIPTNGFRIDIYTILWRSRSVLAFVAVGMLERTADPTRALALARREQRRIAAATR